LPAFLAGEKCSLWASCARSSKLLRNHSHFLVARFHFVHAAIQHDAAAIDEHQIGKHMLNLIHLVRRHHNRAAAVEIVIQQGIVKLLPIENVETQRRLIQHQQLRINRHHQGKMQLGHHALRQLPHSAVTPDRGLRQKAFRLRAIEPRMHAYEIVERLRNSQPARQHRDIGNKTDVAHQQIALRPRVAPEHAQRSLIRSQSENRIQRGRFARAVWTNQSENAPFLNT